MKFLRLSLLMFVTVVTMSLLSSCGGSADGAGVTNVLKRVPSDASAVVVINVGEMMKKVDYNELKKTEMFKRLLSEIKNPELEKIMENPEMSGISMHGQFCMFVDAKTQDDVITNFIMPVKSLKDLETFFEKMTKDSKSIFKDVQKSGNYKYIATKENTDKVGMAWDGKVLAMAFSTKSGLKDNFDKIFDAKRSESIVTNKNFQGDRSAKHDMMLWVQSTPLVKLANANEELSRYLGQISILGLSEKSLNDNSAAIFYDFNNGEMEGGISYKMNKEIESEFGIIFKDKISTDFSTVFPRKNLSGISMMGLDLKGIKKVLDKRNFTGFADMSLSQNGFSVEEITNSLSGEMAVGFYTDPAAKKVTDAKFVFAMSFEKPEFIDKVIGISKKMGSEIKKNGNRFSSKMSKDVQGLLVGKTLVISNDPATLDKIEKGGFKGDEALEKNHYAEMTRGWLSGHVDYNQLIAAAGTMPIDKMMGIPGLKMLQEYNVLESATAVATTKETKAMVYLKDKNENSLKTLTKVMNKVYQDRGKIMKEFDKDNRKDEVPVEDPNM